MEISESKKKGGNGRRENGRRSQSKSIESASRASSATSSQSQSTIQSQSGEFNDLAPEVITGYDLRAHLRQILTFSDDDDFEESSEDDCSLESFDEQDQGNEVDEELQRLMGTDKGAGGQPLTPKPTNQNNSQSLVPITEEDDIDSEEEREIMKEIKNEITNNVRQEMKSELELYKAKREKLEREGEGKTEGNEEGKDEKNSDLDNLEPKLRDAIIKMRKLDKVLMKRIRREKEVKRDRILLERRIRRELLDLHKEGKEEYKEVQNNEHKYLALEMPARHNEGVTVPDEFTGEEVFATQLNEDEYPGLHSHRHKRNKSRKSNSTKGRPDGDTRESSRAGDSESMDDSSSVASGSVHGKRGQKKKDFIKRNKELAADASNIIAMTDEEKKRLEDLLGDVDTIADIPEEPGLLDDDNPFQIAIKPGEGFVPDNDELRSLTSIDSRLKDLMPAEDFSSIASSSMSHVPKHKLFTHTGVKHADDWERRGERALFQNAEQRDLNERMAAIEFELDKLHNPEEAELDTPRLGEDQLQDLIDQCVTSLSRTSMSQMTLNSDSRTSFADTESIISHVDSTPRSPRSARQEILDNPPHLAPDVLQKLLAEAYHPFSKQLSTLQEEDNEDNEGTPIPADVWKLIAQEKVEENGVSHSEDTLNNTDRVKSGSGVYPDQHSARNGLKMFSRNSSASSLASVSDIGTERRESQVVKLPEIDPTGTLITQGANNTQNSNNQRPDSSGLAHTPINIVRNSLSDSQINNNHSDSRMELMSLDGDIMSPHPPSARDKRGGSGKSRTLTPASRVNVT